MILLVHSRKFALEPHGPKSGAEPGVLLRSLSPTVSFNVNDKVQGPFLRDILSRRNERPLRWSKDIAPIAARASGGAFNVRPPARFAQPNFFSYRVNRAWGTLMWIRCRCKLTLKIYIG
jgi:hypothetical protein